MIVFQRPLTARHAAQAGVFVLAFGGFGQAAVVVPTTTYVLASNFAHVTASPRVTDIRPSVSIADRRTTPGIRDRRPSPEIDQP